MIPLSCLAAMAVGAVGSPAAGETGVPLPVPPAQQVFTVEPPVVPDIMGTIAVHIPPNPTTTRWTKIMGASLAQPRLESIVTAARQLSPEGQLAYVQATVSGSVRDLSPDEGCSDDGYWAPAQETLARGWGDCIDVVIAKMEALRALGLPGKDLYLTTGRLRGSVIGAHQRETAALLVRTGARFWLLPDWSSQPIEADVDDGPDARFTPVITYGVGLSWVHGRMFRVAASAISPASPVAR